MSYQLVLCHVAAVKSLPTFIFSADYILLLVLCDQRIYSENSKRDICLDSFYKQIYNILVIFRLYAFDATQYQMECLNAALKFTLTSSLKSKRNMKQLSFLRKSLPVQAYRPLQETFYKTFKNFQNQRGSNSATMHLKNSGWSASTFQYLPKNELQR